MKHLLTTLTLIIAMVLFVSCDNNPDNSLPKIDIAISKSCTYDSQTIEITYKLVEESVPVSVTTSAEWINTIDTSVAGKISFNVDENIGKKRSATLSVAAEGHATAKVKIYQIAAPEETAHTLMFYFFGTSLERYFKTNLEDAKEAIKSGALGECNRVIYLLQTGSRNAHISEICYDPYTKECIERRLENIKLDASLITTDDIGKNIAKMANYAEADRYGIVFAGHGQGWIPREILNGNGSISAFSTMSNMWQPAIGAEVTRAFGESNVQVNPAELAEGIAKSNVKLDYILFDACFMSNIEAIYDLRNAANYIIASPCEIMGRGFPYHRTLPYLFANEGAQSDIIGAAESYYLFYRDEYIGNSRCGSVAVYNCAEVERLAEVTQKLAETATNFYDPTLLQTYEGQTPHQFYDFGQWANRVAQDNAALAAFNSQLENTVIAKFSLPTFYSAYGSYGTYEINLDVYSGVTTSAPSSAYPQAWYKTNWYKYVWQK